MQVIKRGHRNVNECYFACSKKHTVKKYVSKIPPVSHRPPAQDWILKTFVSSAQYVIRIIFIYKYIFLLERIETKWSKSSKVSTNRTAELQLYSPAIFHIYMATSLKMNDNALCSSSSFFIVFLVEVLTHTLASPVWPLIIVGLPPYSRSKSILVWVRPSVSCMKFLLDCY